jgi:hypothetical protein
MYKTQCSKCKRTFETDVKWYNYICDECTRKQKESEKQFDMSMLEKLRKELDDAIASGDQSKIDTATQFYNSWLSSCKRKYGDI